MKHKIVLCILFLFLFVSCAPKAFNPYVPPDLKIDRTPQYDIKSDLEKLPKPDSIVPIYVKKVNDDYIIVETREESSHILLGPEEYRKVGAVLKLTKAYKEIIHMNESIINTYIDEINALKELSMLEREKVISYRELWVNSENMYRSEKYEHKTDNMINRSGMYIITIGSILLLLLLL